MTKHESEKIVRKECKQPWTVYRPALVVGDSTTGEMDKIDGPYYFFKLIQRMREILPPWFPAVGIEGGRFNIVPVDFVVAALDHISHARTSIDGKCYHLVDPVGYRVGDVLDIFSKAAHAPKMNLFINAALFGFVPKSVKKGLMALAPMRRVRNAVMKDLGFPEDMLSFINYPTRFDRRETDAALKGSGIECPKLDTYAWRLWDYWERHLDPDLMIDRSLKGTVGGKVVLITGGSSGIGLSAAKRFAEAGAITVIAARGEDKLAEAKREIIEHAGADAQVFTYPVDIADEAGCAAFVKTLEEQHGGVDFLINNAGRSIRRAIEASYDRFHDFERTMTLNYFGSLRITMGLLPGMVKKRKGHVVNISSISVLVNAPRFSAYVASKAALDAWTACASSEFADQGVTFTTVNMPLVRTPMTAPTKIYDSMPLLMPEEAADMIVRACVYKPVRVATRLGIFGEVLHAAAPRVTQIVMNTTFRMFPDSAAAKGDKAAKPALSAEAVAMANMMRGIHF
jgi:NAD(P)-dependent dehydrogenase (short-subunit alcohol dehydrogenase family)